MVEPHVRELRPAPVNPALTPVPNELAQFLMSYFHDGRIALAPPQRNVLVFEGATSVVLYRRAPFQVELVIVQPNTHIPAHCHDDVDSFEVAIAGGIDLSIDGMRAAQVRSPNRHEMMRDFARYVPVACTAMHGGTAGPDGACFLSVQRWRDGAVPTHIALNWRGAALGPQHQESLNG